ncbi:unnamed protein product, partial [marine sediment metagenome]
MDNLRQLKLVRKEAKRIADFWGNIQVGSGATDAAGDATVTFPGGFTFSSTPKVFLQGLDAAAKGIVLDVVSKTVTGFAVKARKVTGVDSGGAVGTVTPIGTAYLWGVDDPGHHHTNPATGGPSTTATVASSTHTHSFTPSGTVSTFTGNTAGATGTTDPGVGGTAYTWGYEGGSDSHSHTNPNTGSVGGHTHGIGSPSTASFITGGTKYTTPVASSYHTHSGTTGTHNSATITG